jgi:hypothetical protein
MKHSFLASLLILSCISLLNAQTKKEVDNGIFVTFPVSPEYKTTTAASTYVGKTENCLFMVIIQRNAIPNYAEYVKAKQDWTDAEIEKVENSFLDNAVKGKLDYSGNKGIVSTIKIGKYSGRKIDYSAINPTTGERGKRFTKLFLVRDRAISFEVWLLKDSQIANIEKDKFLNSIQAQ